MREALERLKASSMTSSSIRFSLTGGPVGCTTKTSAPRTLSWIWNQTSPSLKRGEVGAAEGHAQEAGDGLAQRGVRAPGEDPQLSTHAPRRSLPFVRRPHRLAGAEGFEPSNTGSKAPRLTAWPRPNRATTEAPRGRSRRCLASLAPSPAALGRRRSRRRSAAARRRRPCAAPGALRHLLPVHREHLLLEVLPHLVVQRMRDVLERPVLPLLARHRDEQPLRARG